jgi:signal transduction histidine kinase
MVGTLVVQFIALLSNFLMGFYATPVMQDPVTGLRIHLVRWAEWTPLAFLMTFLTANIDAPMRVSQDSKTTLSYWYPACLGLSTFAGLVFPFCDTLFKWILNNTVSCILFLALYGLLYERATAYYDFKREYLSGTLSKARNQILTADQQEHFEVVRSSYVLSIVCSVSWTALVVFFLVGCAGSYFKLPGVIGNEQFNSSGLCFFEILSKIWYLSVLIDVYEKTFDEKIRAVRRLEELRNFMTAVWESSSDVIVFCGTHNGRVSARISPAFLKLIGLSTGKVDFLNRGAVSLVLDISPETETFCVFAFDLSMPVTRAYVSRMKQSLASSIKTWKNLELLPMEDRNIAIMAQLAAKASKVEGKEVCLNLRKCLVAFDERGNEVELRCEAKTSKLEAGSTVLVLRDISDRIQRFEAEKKLVREMTTRKKDAETNKFSRHEIKNGILSAIALLDHIRDTMDRQGRLPTSDKNCGTMTDHFPEINENSELLTHELMQALGSSDDNFARGTACSEEMDQAINELGNTLGDILDTILDQAMAREIVYGEYQPRNENMDVPEVLCSLRRRTSPRFPMSVHPSKFPLLPLDRQLLRFIYRNALSNACKYGKIDGMVETVVNYNTDDRLLRLEVINLPGFGHEELLKLNSDETASVFQAGIQLGATRSVAGATAQIVRNESSGNGAWIMQKCAEALGGLCSIRFEEKQTVFSLTCPVRDTQNARHTGVEEEVEPFCLPDNCWGIVLDDSAIQRKLMERFLMMAGIHDSKRRIYGSGAEVFGFCDTVADLIAKHPDDFFIVIADENLDIVVGGATSETVSGSLCVEKLRQQLDNSDERRLLALIRSANDSVSDLELYTSRAHGYLLKEPVKGGKVLDIIRPWWLQRFGQKHRRRSLSNVPKDVEQYGPSPKDIRDSFDVIDALLSVKDESILAKRQPTIREKIHKLKGDIKTMKTKSELVPIAARLNLLLDDRVGVDQFKSCWIDAKACIEGML